MADIDWNRWLPPHALPDTGRKDFRPGQVWAVRTGHGQPGVFLVKTLHPDSAGGGVDSTDRLAGACENWHPAPSSPNAEQAVLVQDVGQPEPTPPDVLYGRVCWWCAKRDDRNNVGHCSGEKQFHSRCWDLWQSAGYPEKVPGSMWIVKTNGPMIWASEAEPSELLEEAPVVRKEGPHLEQWHGWRPGQKRQVVHGNGVVAGYLRHSGNAKPDDWMVDKELNQRLGSSTYVGSSSSRSVLLEEAPAPAGQTTEGWMVAAMRDPLDPEKVARAREAIDRLTARTVPPPPPLAEGQCPMFDNSRFGPKPRCLLKAGHDGVEHPGHADRINAPALREVSTNGRDWVDYTTLIDPDPFESYTHRAIDGVGDVVIVAQVCREPGCEGIGLTRFIVGGAEAVLCDSCYVRGERWITGEQRWECANENLEAHRRSADTHAEVVDQPSLATAYPKTFGGIWRTR